MTTHKKLLFTCLIILLVVIHINSVAGSRRYSIDQIKIEAEILPDGSLRIAENRSYSFQGSYSWADYSLPLKDLGRVTDFELDEDGLPYRRGLNEEPGSYQYFQDEERMYVKWFYRARDESRSFTLKYRVEDAVTVYNDVAELYYKFVSEKNEKSIGSVEVRVTFPYVADTSQVRAWAHGPLHGQLVFENGGIRLWTAPLTRKTWWEVRTIFPRQWVPGALKQRNEMAREKIMNEERLLVEKSNVQRMSLIQKRQFQEKYRGTAFNIGVILSLVGLVALLLLYHRYGTAFEVAGTARISSEIPQHVSPAIANYVYFSGQIGAGALVATMLDLARRGFLKLEETVQQKKSLFGIRHQKKYCLKFIPEMFEHNKDQLAPYEQDLLQFIFQNLAQGENEIGLDQIKRSSHKVTPWFSNWKRVIKNQWGNRPLYDRSSVKGTIFCGLISLVILASGIVIAVYFGTPGVIAVLTGAILFGLSFIILRYTKEVKLLRAKLGALRSYLVKYHFKNDLSRLRSSIEELLVYGVALGIGSKAMRELLSMAPEWQSGSFFAWYVSSAGHGSSTSFATALTSMVSAASATMGSAAGIGGGAATGGGAGAGGASGGAG